MSMVKPHLMKKKQNSGEWLFLKFHAENLQWILESCLMRKSDHSNMSIDKKN